MRRPSSKLGRCYACFNTERERANPNSSWVGTSKCPKARAPRKLKKLLKKADIFHSADWNTLTQCDFVIRKKEYSWQKMSKFRHERNYRLRIQFLWRHWESIKRIQDLQDHLDSPFDITKNYNLGWGWEEDGDYGGSSGVIEFHYEQKANYWSYDEVCWLMKKFGLDQQELQLNSDRELLKLLKNRKPVTD